MLKELEAIDNANPSESLKYLEKIKTKFRDTCLGIYLEDTKEFDTIKQALLKAQFLEKENAELKVKTQEQDKVLKIIKEKNVDIYLLKDARNLEEYNRWISQRGRHYYRPTEEEFDLLKRYFDER